MLDLTFIEEKKRGFFSQEKPLDLSNLVWKPAEKGVCALVLPENEFFTPFKGFELTYT